MWDSDASNDGSVAPRVCPPLDWSSGRGTGSIWSATRALAASMPSRTASWDTPRRSATSATVGRPVQLVGQVLGAAADLQVHLLAATGRPHGPAAVAQVALELALDGAGGEGAERCALPRLVALGGVDDGDQRGLAQVLDRRRARSGEPPHLEAGDVQVGLDHPVAQCPVAGELVLGEQLLDLVRVRSCSGPPVAIRIPYPSTAGGRRDPWPAAGADRQQVERRWGRRPVDQMARTRIAATSSFTSEPGVVHAAVAPATRPVRNVSAS